MSYPARSTGLPLPPRAGWARASRPPARQHAGTTRAPASAGSGLLELLLVVTLMAIVAAAGLHFAGSRQEALRSDLALVELVRLKDAVLAFERDTGHLPRQGPFALADDSRPGRVATPELGPLWFHHPFNIVQLLEQPVDPNGRAVLPFSIDTGRGWRGPYLRHGTEGLVRAGTGLAHDGSGDPTAGSLLDPMPAVADPFDHHRPTAEGFLAWSPPLTDGPTPLGRPIALVGFDDPALARLIGFGPNGRYEEGEGDDLVLPLR